ncbi:MAG: putative DNA modification/repair radical SAM protein [Candidatus Heimdallarchaeota archaeon]|nr:putative DNA modification/repair radical SAM protein [Candidatus Heimdallarchaeota archaeon]
MPGILEKLRILGEAAKYDLCASTASPRAHTPGSIGKAVTTGVCHSFLPDGRCISLLKVLATNSCIHDCKYCINSIRNNKDFKQTITSFEPDELAKLTMAFYLRNYIEGLFLSSGVGKSANCQAEIIHETLHLLRYKYNFDGYIHAKVLPGIGKDELFRIAELADRVSLNVELPNKSRFNETCSTKDYANDIIKVSKFLPEMSKTGHIPAGYTTQYVIGAAGETDKEILESIFKFYNEDWNFRRQYYSTCLPIDETQRNLPRSFFLREHRLYQIDWLRRIYKFSPEELLSVVNETGFIPLKVDPKVTIARENPEFFPVDVNNALYADLMRVPGIGHTSATRIIKLRNKGVAIYKNEQLKTIGVVLKRAIPFLKIGEKKQLTMVDFQKTEESD